jgi:hypothetical protein
MRQSQPRTWWKNLLCAVVVLHALALAPASAQSLRGTPLVLSWQSLPEVSYLNPDVQLEVLRLSEIPLGQARDLLQTVVVDVVHEDRRFRGADTIPLLIPEQDVSLVQQLNADVQVEVDEVFQEPVNERGQYAQVAEVWLTETRADRDRLGTPLFLLVVPTETVPALVELNEEYIVSALRYSQIQTGQFNPLGQTALVALHENGTRFDRDEPLPLLLPAVDLPLVEQLNVGAVIDTVDLFPVTYRPTGQTLQVADVDVWEDRRLLERLNRYDEDDDDDFDFDDDDD